MNWLPRVKKIVIVSISVSLLIAAFFGITREKEFFTIKDLKVDLNFQTNQEPLLVSLKPTLMQPFEALKGQNIWRVSLGELRTQLLANPWIRQVEVRRRFPSEIFSLIHFRSVSLLFVDGRNRIFPVLETGQKMPAIKANVAPLAPILRNNNIFKDKKKLQHVLSLLKEVPEIGAFENTNISSVDFHSVAGLTLQLIDGDVTVHLGDKNIQTKALQVLRVIDYLKTQKHKARVIDASFTKKVLVRPRKRS